MSFAFDGFFPLLIYCGEDYDWRELWNSVIALLDFLALKIETLHTTGGVELLASEVFGSFPEMKLNSGWAGL